MKEICHFLFFPKVQIGSIIVRDSCFVLSQRCKKSCRRRGSWTKSTKTLLFWTLWLTKVSSMPHQTIGFCGIVRQKFSNSSQDSVAFCCRESWTKTGRAQGTQDAQDGRGKLTTNVLRKKQPAQEEQQAKELRTAARKL